jgi:hypothetical protein
MPPEPGRVKRAHAKYPDESIELLAARHGERLNTRAKRTPSAVDRRMEAMDELHGTEDATR